MRHNPWMLPLLLLMQTLFVGTTFRTAAALVVAYFVFQLAAYRNRKRASPAASRAASRKTFSSTFVWSISLLFAAALVTVWRLSNHYGESFNPVAFFVDSFAHASLIFGLMFHVRRPMFGHPAMLGLGLLVVMLSMASGASSQSIAAQVTVSLVACIAFLFASRFILHAWYIDQRAKRGQTVLANRSRQEGRSFTGSTVDGSSNRFLGLDQRFGVDRQRIGWLFTVVTLSVLLMTTSGLASLTSTVLPEVQRFVQDRLKSSLEAVNVAESIGSSHYVRGARLGSLRRVMMVNPGEIALRAHSDYRPGYLRGSVFDYYSQGRWEEFDNSQVRSSQAIRSYERRTVRSSGAGTVALRGRSYVKLRRFEVGEPGNQTFSTVQIENDPSKGYVFFSPLGTQWIEARASRVSVNSHGVIESGINTQYPYIAGVSSRPAVDPMDPRRREVLTYLDNPTRAFVSKLASDVCDDQLTSINKAAAIANHFQENYEYSLQGAPVPGRGDPLFHFLKTKHPAHCELFASATVLMLRSVGVPARYVTGYISDEFSDEEESWVARNKDAHAWAEAYDDVRQVWFPVESTPGRSYMTLSLEGENRNSLADTLIRLEEDSSDSVSVVSRITGWLLSSRATDPLSILIRFAQVPLFLLGVILLWRRLRRGQSTGLSDDDIKSRKMLALVDRKLARLSFHRAVGETLHQFAGRIENAESLPQPGRSESSSVNDFRAVRGYANWYREFAEARYQGRLPEPYVER